MKLLLDTHVLLWLHGDGGRLSAEQRGALAAVSPRAPHLVADISLLEIALLHEKRRIQLALPLRDWLEAAVAPPLVERVGLSPAIAAEVAALHDRMHRDPADRVLVATARVLGARLVTCDGRVRESGLVEVL
jgi:PIN domain nuclease of toxin-antitoxin system